MLWGGGADGRRRRGGGGGETQREVDCLLHFSSLMEHNSSDGGRGKVDEQRWNNVFVCVLVSLALMTMRGGRRERGMDGWRAGEVVIRSYYYLWLHCWQAKHSKW